MCGEKVIVIGCPGSGKSTFARALSGITGLPLYHLDLLYWHEDRTTVPRELFHARLAEILGEERWIIDGNYGGTMEMRLNACDTVFFLDYPLDVCLDGIRARFGKPRKDMPWVEKEPDADFLQFIKNFNDESRPRILTLLNACPDKTVITFHERAEADVYLQKISR